MRSIIKGAASVASVGSIFGLVVALALGTAACKDDPPIAGVRNWQIGKTVRGDFRGHCSEDGGVAWCVDQRGAQMGEQAATLELYFAGTAPDSPLSEIMLSVRACRDSTVASWLVHKLGEPTEKSDKRMFWRNKLAFMAAQLHIDGTDCTLSMVPPSDDKRIAELRGDSGGGDSGDSAGGSR